MELRVLALIGDNPDAAKLVATWPIVGPDAEVVVDFSGREVKLSDSDVAYWASLSGVDVEDIERMLPMLFHTEICKVGGTIDSHASTFLTNVIRNKLPDQR